MHFCIGYMRCLLLSSAKTKIPGCFPESRDRLKLFSISWFLQGGPKVGIQLLKVGFGSKSRFVVLM